MPVAADALPDQTTFPKRYDDGRRKLRHGSHSRLRCRRAEEIVGKAFGSGNHSATAQQLYVTLVNCVGVEHSRNTLFSGPVRNGEGKCGLVAIKHHYLRARGCEIHVGSSQTVGVSFVVDDRTSPVRFDEDSRNWGRLCPTHNQCGIDAGSVKLGHMLVAVDIAPEIAGKGYRCAKYGRRHRRVGSSATPATDKRMGARLLIGRRVMIHGKDEVITGMADTQNRKRVHKSPFP